MQEAKMKKGSDRKVAKERTASPGAPKGAKSAAKSLARRRLEFPIVGIGASAGGVEAFAKLIEHLPADSGMAFVLVPHLAPAHKSELAVVLGRKSHIPITEAQQGQLVEANCVYVIPPNKQMVFEGGKLRLSARDDRSGTPRAIDI